MSRQSSDELASDGTILNGFDYNLQVWVMQGHVMECGHRRPSANYGTEPKTCCNAAKFRGQKVKDVLGHEVRPARS